MTKRVKFSTHVGNKDVEVIANVSPYVPARMYLSNGDPGYPEEPADVEILSIDGIEPDVFTETVLERLWDEAMEEASYEEEPPEKDW